MAYGILKCDTVTFTNAGVDKSVTLSGLVQNPTFSGNVTVTGTVSGTTATFTTGTFTSLTGTTSQGTTATYTSGSFTSLTGVTTSGTTANFVSGVFTTQISGATITGTAGAFATLTGGVATLTSGVFALGTQALPSITFTGDTDTGIYSPGANQVAITTSGTGRLFVNANGNVGVGTNDPSARFHVNQSASGNAVTEYIRLSSDAGNDAMSMRIAGYAYVGNVKTAIDFIQNAASNFQSKIVFSTSAGSDAIERVRIDDQGTVNIKGAGTAGVTQAVSFNGSAPVNSLVVDSSGRLLVGTSSRRRVGTPFDPVGGVFYEGSGAASYEAFIAAVNRDDNVAAVLAFGKSRGTTNGSNTIVVNGDELGVIRFAGADGTDLESVGAEIKAEVDGTPAYAATALVNGQTYRIVTVGTTNFTLIGASANTVGTVFTATGPGTGTGTAILNAGNMPGRLVFSTTADGASSPTERMRITSGGYFKATSDNAYTNASGLFHEVYSANASEPVLLATATSNSYTGQGYDIRANRAASNLYAFFRALSSNGGSVDNEFVLYGDGNGNCDGAWTGGGADYAEYFEWSDSNPDAEDRRGISVVLDGDKIREAVAGEDPIGVISGNPSVVGDAAWNKWSGKYLRDEYGTYIQEDYEVEDEDGNTVIQQRRKLNPAYDPEVEYVSRENRPEWDCVGLMGKLRIRKGQVTGSRWIKMRDISATVEEWLVR